ncbi:MAG: type II toxin-antitoxin system HipA family toxin [Candidatus Limnocylindrales bacterium]
MTGELSDHVEVYLDAADLGPCRRVGVLRRTGPGDTPIAFAYDKTWLDDEAFFVLDPSHYPFGGDQYPREGALAGVFTDTSPDRWGRILLERREAERAHAEGRRAHQMGEWEFLLGVNDALRMGAIRFASPGGRPFLDDDPLAIPPTAELRELEQAAREIEHPSRRGPEPAMHLAITHLLAPGSPLGGARPKTSFHLDDGALWMAKFPSHNDRRDMGAWEFVLNELARRAGIRVPESRLMVFAGPYHTFVARRFDRQGIGRRLFGSAMTLVGKRDREASSYIEIAEAIEHNVAPAAIDTDLKELFRRLVFNIITGHRDDHLRNHGFLRFPAGWRLAPAFDLNPMPDMREHELAVGLETHAPVVDVALTETAPFCRLSPGEAHELVADVEAAVSAWRQVAVDTGLPDHEIDAMASVFPA